MARAEDFFGVDTLSADPYYQQRSNQLNLYNSLDSILSGGGDKTAAGEESQGEMPSGSSTYGGGGSYLPQPAGGGAANPYASMLANFFMTQGTGGSYQPTGMTRSPDDPSNPNPGLPQRPNTGGGGTGDAPPDTPPGGNTGGSRPPYPGTDVCPGGAVWRDDPSGGYWVCTTADGDGDPSNDPPPDGPPPAPRTPGGGGTGGTGGGGGGGGGTNERDPRDDAGGYGSGGPYTDSTIPADLKALRARMGQWLTGNFANQNQPYGGNLNVGSSPYEQMALNAMQGSGGDINNWLNMGKGTLGNLMNFQTGSDLSSLMGPLQKMLSGQGAQMDPGLRQRLVEYGDAMVPEAQQFGATQGAYINAASNPIAQAMQFAQQGYNQAQPYMQQGANMFNQVGSVADLMRTGGLPDMQKALDDIRNRGMMDIEDQNAQNREKYGSMGLGAGSDVAEAVARGSSRGIADINSQQSQLISQLMSQAADRRIAATSPFLQAGQGMSGLAGTASGVAGAAGQGMMAGAGGMLNQAGSVGNVMQQILAARQAASGNFQNLTGTDLASQNAGLDRILQGLTSGQNILNNPANMALASAGVQGNAAGMLPGFAQGAGSAGSNYANILAQLAQMDTNRQGNNINMAYQNFIQSQQRPYLGTAAGYATGFPPQDPVIQSGGGSNIWSAIGGIGGAIAGALPWAAMLSDENMKEDIEEVVVNKKPFTTLLKDLPIKRWRYKGDPVKHIGPMAQDMKRVFGVGDGHTIFIPDMLNILLGTVKEMARA